MSRHTMDTRINGYPATVCVGWDPCLGRLFLDIIQQETEQTPEQLIYSSDNQPSPPSIEQIGAVLARFGITAPRGMLAAVATDMRLQDGTRTAHWGAPAAAGCPSPTP